MSDIELSVVIPVYKCSECLRHLHDRLDLALAQIPGEHEIIFVDDRSPDESWGILRELADQDDSVGVVRLSRNFADDHEQLAQGMILYDALYSWAKHVRSERHTWNPQRGPTPVPVGV